MYFVALNLKTWLRACPCGQPASNLALLRRSAYTVHTTPNCSRNHATQ